MSESLDDVLGIAFIPLGILAFMVLAELMPLWP